MERIDKMLALILNESRADVKSYIKKGLIKVDGVVIKDSGYKVSEDACITYNGRELAYNKYIYIMMNKPKGVISASEGRSEKTVVDILPSEMQRRGLFPAGRLDKDTTGFVLITDDGDFAHRILSPKNHIPKTYIATLDKPFDQRVIDEFEKGLELKDEVCMPARLECVDGDYCRAKIEIKQGMYHQIKRMFKKFGITVMELDRIKMGSLRLDGNLAPGECRYLTKDELELIKSDNK